MNANRKLGFERLESKCAPTSVLLVVASAPDPMQRAFEEATESNQAACPAADHWQAHHSSQDLLRFVERETYDNGPAPVAHQPTPQECATSDELMKLHDDELRSLVIHTL